MRSEQKQIIKINSPLRFLKQKHIMVIDIGMDRTKVVVGSAKVKGSEYGFHIQSYFTFSTPRKPVVDPGFLMGLEEEKDFLFFDKDIFRDRFNQKIKEYQIKAKQAVLTVENDAMISREFLLPLGKEDEMESMVRFEAEQYLPINIDQYTIQYKIIEKVVEEESKKARVLVCALPKEIGKQYFQLLQFLQLKPIALDTHSNGFAKFFDHKARINEGYENPKEMTIALLDLGYQQMNINIIEKGIIRFNRLLNGGGKELDEQIATSFNLTLEEAAKKKLETNVDLREEGTYSFTEEAMVQQIIRTNVLAWLENIQRMFNYYTSRDRNNRIDKIYIVGGCSRFMGLVEYMEEVLEIPTERILGLDNIDQNQNGDEFSISDYFNGITALIRK